MPATSAKPDRAQVGIRLDKRLTKVLKGMAEYLDVSLNDLVERTLLHAISAEEQTALPAWRTRKARMVGSDLKRVYDLDEDAVRELLKPMVMPSDEPSARLFLALRQGQASTAMHLLREFPELTDARDSEGFTPLIAAARINAVAIIDHCLAAGVPLEEVDLEYEDTAIGWAAYYGNREAVARLLEHHPRLDHRANDGYTALGNAIRGRDGKLVKLGVYAPPSQFEPVIALLEAAGAVG